MMASNGSPRVYPPMTNSWHLFTFAVARESIPERTRTEHQQENPTISRSACFVFDNGRRLFCSGSGTKRAQAWAPMMNPACLKSGIYHINQPYKSTFQCRISMAIVDMIVYAVLGMLNIAISV